LLQVKQCEKMANAFGKSFSGNSTTPDRVRPFEFLNVTFSLFIVTLTLVEEKCS